MIRLKNVSYTYPFGLRPAVKNINLNVNTGEIVLCTGASGCGKSTLIRLINGLCPHYYMGSLSGSVFIGGEDSADKTVAEISSMVGTLFQDPEQQFFALNVEDEMAFALEWKGFAREEIREKIYKSAEQFGITDIMQSSVYKLSEGQKQKVGLGSVFAQSPKAIILDEPTANLDPEATSELAEKLVELKNSGIAVFIADHRLYWLKGIADKIIVMDDGEIAFEGRFDALEDGILCERHGLRSPVVADGRNTMKDCRLTDGVPSVSASGVSFNWPSGKRIFDNVSFDIPAGITALVGKNGVGKTTLARLLTGLTKTDSGKFFINGREVGKDTLFAGAALVLQNADHQLYMKTAAQEVETCLHLSGKFQSKKAVLEEAAGLLKLFALEKLAGRHPQSLSGGEKQRLVIACAFAKKPKILILDEPTSGLDGANMKRIASALNSLAGQGVSVLLITHDLELMDMACAQALRLPLKGGC